MCFTRDLPSLYKNKYHSVNHRHRCKNTPQRGYKNFNTQGKVVFTSNHSMLGQGHVSLYS